MAARQIRKPGAASLTSTPVVTVLPPREGFSPGAVGAVGLLVHRLGQPGDVVVGERTAIPFAGRHFVPAARAWWPPGRAGRYTAGVVRTLRRLNPRLIEVHNRANLAWRLARTFPQARIALFVHNDPQAMRQAGRPAERAALLERMTVVCVSHHLAARFTEGLKPGGPAPEVLPNALDFAALPPLADPADRLPEILFAGRTVADKGADAFVEACAAALPRLPGWGAAMIGADRFWPGSATTAFERALHPRAQAAGIQQHGYLPHAAVLQAMARAAIVVVPSRWAEPFGLVALEAMACGAALVCSMRGGLAEVVGDAALPADPDQPGALAAAIERLARDPDLRASRAQAGLARARLFDAADVRARLGELRRRLLGT